MMLPPRRWMLMISSYAKSLGIENDIKNADSTQLAKRFYGKPHPHRLRRISYGLVSDLPPI
jgi:hypothetical protein